MQYLLRSWTLPNRSLATQATTKLTAATSASAASVQPKRKTMDPNIKIRDNPVVVKLDSAEFKSIFTKNLQQLVKVFDKYNYEIRIAGGAVR